MKTYTKKKLSSLLAITLSFSLLPVFAFDANASEIYSERKAECESKISALSDCEYEKGSAIVTLTASENAALMKTGVCSFDSHITVEKINDFDDEYVAYLTSDKYSTEELIKKAYDIYYVKSASANKKYELATVNDPGATVQWHLSDIKLDSVPEVSSLDDVVVAVIDTGVDYTHDDLKNSMWVNPVSDKLPGTYGYDAGDGDTDPMDTNGHGTHVSGIIAAESNNGIGVSGISSAKIMAVKATRGAEDGLYSNSVVDSFEYIKNAIDYGVNVKAINCSWAGGVDYELSDIINTLGRKGAVTVFAAGNDGADMDSSDMYSVPFKLDREYLVTVGYSGTNDARAEYSNFGKNSVDIFAPGDDIFSTYIKSDGKNRFSPMVFSQKEREATCLYLSTIGESELNILPTENSLLPLTAGEIGMPSDFTSYKTVEKEGDNSYLNIELSIMPENYDPNASDREHIGSIYLDVTDLNLDESATYYVSCHISGLTTSTQYWTTDFFKSDATDSRFVNYNGRTYFRIVGVSAGGFGVFNIKIDNIAISKANVTLSDCSGYSYLTGTSMAAPMVTGAIALVAQMAPKLSAAELKATVLNSVRKVDALTDYCVTGGVIDLSKLSIYADSLTLNKETVTLKYGKTVSLKAKLSPSDTINTAVKWTVSNTKYARITQNGTVKAKKAGIGHKVKVVAATANGKKDYCIVKIKG